MKQVKNKQLIADVFLHIKNFGGLNATVKSLIAEYEEKNGKLLYSKEKENENDNENDNDNEVSYPVSYNDTLTIRSQSTKTSGNPFLNIKAGGYR
jgi:hypothetical protein